QGPPGGRPVSRRQRRNFRRVRNKRRRRFLACLAAHFFRLYVTFTMGCSLPSLSSVETVKRIVSSSFLWLTVLNREGLPSMPRPSPSMVRTLLSLSNVPSEIIGAADSESTQMLTYFFRAGS